ncbi:SSU rRNA (adenine(1518)-N(6)/adenine(1519)-N(6))- dimethyltransferase [Pseudomonas sp. R5-89-07]|nr:SSU rRNA (adenine(1518)-N(6)/adenine(1519)-N(6))- dimethyltransferase [Pseudomonas sp. R5-89-07]
MTEHYQHRARKRFGQNFLHDAGVIDRILRSIHAKPEDRLLEIGPGQGALTQGLLASGGQLDVVELDKDLIPILNQQFADKPNFNLHQGDALKFDFNSLNAAPNSLRVVGNLPYNISTPLIFHLLNNAGIIRDMHFMLQKEVVERLAAGPGGVIGAVCRSWFSTIAAWNICSTWAQVHSTRHRRSTRPSCAWCRMPCCRTRPRTTNCWSASCAKPSTNAARPCATRSRRC